jgi:hypothetical protein
MRLSPAAFNRHLKHMGQNVEWRAATACPCVNPFSGAADPTCPQCRGKGHTWAAAVAGVVGVTRQDTNPEWKDFGNFEAGDMTLSIGSDSPLYDMGRFDRVVLMNATDRFSRVMTRGEGDFLDLRLKSIDRVFWLNSAKTTQIEGGIPDWNPITGALTWEEGEPPFGTQYSITGEKYEEYFAWVMLPSSRNEHQGAPLPKRMTARRWDLFGR